MNLQVCLGVNSRVEMSFSLDKIDSCNQLNNFGEFPFKDPNKKIYYMASPDNNKNGEPYITTAYYSEFHFAVDIIGIPLYENNEFIGFIGSYINFFDIYNEIISQKPALTGCYMIICKNGLVLESDDDCIKIIYGNEIPKSNVINGLMPLQNGFEAVINSINIGLNSLTVTSKTDDITYYVDISDSIRNMIYILSIIPNNDIDTSKKWSVSNNILSFKYSSSDIYQSVEFIIENHSDYELEYYMEYGIIINIIIR